MISWILEVDQIWSSPISINYCLAQLAVYDSNAMLPFSQIRK